MVERISFLGKEWTIDNKDLVFTDATLNQFFEKIGGILIIIIISGIVISLLLGLNIGISLISTDCCK